MANRSRMAKRKFKRRKRDGEEKKTRNRIKLTIFTDLSPLWAVLIKFVDTVCFTAHKHGIGCIELWTTCTVLSTDKNIDLSHKLYDHVQLKVRGHIILSARRIIGRCASPKFKMHSLAWKGAFNWFKGMLLHYFFFLFSATSVCHYCYYWRQRSKIKWITLGELQCTRYCQHTHTHTHRNEW